MAWKILGFRVPCRLLRFGDIYKMVRIFYHACPVEDTESILREGLLRKKSSLWKASGGAIYLTRGMDWMHESDVHNILEIRMPDKYFNETEIWGKDEYLNKDAKRWQWICWEDIPKEFIRKIK